MEAAKDAVQEGLEKLNVKQAKPKKEPKQKQSQAPKPKQEKKVEGAKLIGIDVSKSVDLAEWYKQVLLKGEMIDYYDVSGCYILRPSSYSIWETIQDYFNTRIKKMGVDNCYFPLFISEDNLQREKDHLEGFAAEVAWVTHG